MIDHLLGYSIEDVQRLILERDEARKARTMMMLEADHRIKNSLQQTSSLLRLQIKRTHDAVAKDALEAAAARVDSIAETHRALQYSDDPQAMDFDNLLKSLCDRLALLNPAVDLKCESSIDFLVKADAAIPLCLIANELLTNALRHAFPPETPGVVTLTAVVDENLLRMTIADGGAGLPTSPLEPGLGTAVVAGLATQVGATLVIQSEPGQGTRIFLSVSLDKLAATQSRPASANASAG